jgi:hypothetical protein
MTFFPILLMLGQTAALVNYKTQGEGLSMRMKNRWQRLGMLFYIVACLPIVAESAKVTEVASGKITVYSSVANAGTGAASLSFSGMPAQILYGELTHVVATEQKLVDGAIYIKNGPNLICYREVKKSAMPQYSCGTAVFPDGSTGYDEP